MTALPVSEARLSSLLAEPGPSLVLLRGHRLTGKSLLLRRRLEHAAEAKRVASHRGLALPADDLRSLFARDLARALGAGPSAPHSAPPALPTSSWSGLLRELGRVLEASRQPLVVAVDDAHELLAAQDGIHRALLDLRAHLRAHALPVHIVLCGTSPYLEQALEGPDGNLREAVTHDLQVHLLGVRDAARRVRSQEPRERLRTWAVFGGAPAVLDLLEPSLPLRENVRRLFLSPDAPLADWGMRRLHRDVQSPARYAAILRALAVGARDWGQVARGSAGFTSGSQMAPYLGRLEELGLVDVRRSLDAGPNSRSRRYEISDPLVAFWFGFVLPLSGQVAFRSSPELWEASILPALDLHVARFYPRACRDWLRSYGDQVLPARGREVGSLWGPEYDLEVAGTLENGATVYGVARWSDEPADEAALDDVGRQLRHTRYGFGREARLRVVFNAGGFTPEAHRRAARDPLADVVGLEELLGQDG